MGSQKGGEWQHQRGSLADKLGESFINKGLYENPEDEKFREWQRQRNSKFGLGNYAPGGYFSNDQLALRKRQEEDAEKGRQTVARMAAIPETTEGRRGFLNTEVESRKDIWDKPKEDNSALQFFVRGD